ncbi:MAG: hypothetical protein P0Y59_02580 [Candidatus Sphingomonas phytovorans]|nr:hypothetical protein [Sphingomonas sp.]WEK00597.1 MAG: hypothetical protein P0Y59_02580 [Sphingomonas sp.]
MAGNSFGSSGKGSLTWTGDAVKERLRKAQIRGVNATMGACVVEAKSNHPWQNRTTVLEGGIDVVDYAVPVEAGVTGTWGVRDVVYALMIEVGGTIQHPGGTAYFIGSDGMAKFVSNDDPKAAGLPRTKPHEIVIPAHPYLRPAADKLYPTLSDRIRVAYDKLAPSAEGGTNG